MSDVLFLYLFTRLDVLSGILVALAIISGIFTVCLCVWALVASNADPERWHSSTYKRQEERQLQRFPTIVKWTKRLAAVFLCLLVFNVLIPGKKDMAIIVGGKFALDMARSDTAAEVGHEVLQAIRGQLREMAK
jgi:hypothetical protein